MKGLKLASGIAECFLGIPLLGAAFVMGFAYVPLLIMLALHIVTLVFYVKNNGRYAFSILGIVTSCVAWIPGVGFVMHIVTGILLIVEASKEFKETQHNQSSLI